MKRINPLTGVEFKQGDVREDGKLFWMYQQSRIKSNGFFIETWLNSDSYDKCQKTKLASYKNRLKTHPEKHKKSVSKWAKSNRHKRNATEAKRRAVKLQATPPWLTKEQFLQIDEYYLMAKELEKVFPWPQHVDHEVALQGENVCGLHVPWNLQILSRKENLSKGNR